MERLISGEEIDFRSDVRSSDSNRFPVKFRHYFACMDSSNCSVTYFGVCDSEWFKGKSTLERDDFESCIKSPGPLAKWQPMLVNHAECSGIVISLFAVSCRRLVHFLIR
jgi:hypothetical protein